MRLKAIYRLYKENLIKKTNSILEFLIDIVYDRVDGIFADVLGFFLNCFSMVFSRIIKLRYFLYRKKILKDTPLGTLVVVVGNITVGGTGKTPVVEMLAKKLKENGRNVAIVSRGYKSKNDPYFFSLIKKITHSKNPPPKIVSDGNKVLLNSKIAGDEPFMLAKNLPGVIVLCDKDRVKAGSYAIKKFKCDTIVLDDGFQYLKLRGSLNLCLVDSTNPFGNGKLLPRGILREPLHRLSRADYIFLTKSINENIEDELYKTIKRYNNKAKIIYCRHSPKSLVAIRRIDESKTTDFLAGKKIAVFSGIAYPESFEKTLLDLKADLTYKKRFLDHHRFNKSEIKSVMNDAMRNNVDFIVTTEKDAVRLPEIEFKVPIYYLRLEIEIIYGEKDFNALSKRICLYNS